MKRYLAFLLPIFILNLTCSAQAYDIVIYGATPSGIAAAVAASREGKSVLIIEPLLIVGGMMSSGLSFSDSNQMARETLGGIFEEIHERIEKEYLNQDVALPYDVKIKDEKPWTYEPHIAEKVFNDILNEADVKVALNETLKSVVKNGNVIKAVVTYSKKHYYGKVFIDASYEGDLLACAKVRYRIGRESQNEYNESLAGARYPKGIVPIPTLKNKGKLLPLITGDQLVPVGRGDKKIMTYSFRLCFSRDSNNQIPITKPKDYNPDRYELFRRYYLVFPESSSPPFDMFPIPGNKYDINNGIELQISTGLVGRSWKYPEATKKKRKIIWELHRSYTEGLMYFLTTDISVPEEIRNQMKKIGYAKDEFLVSGNFPSVLYVREARRIIGCYIMTQADILKNTTKPDPIGIGSFPIDSHDCQRISIDNEGFIDEGTILPVHINDREIGQPYQIPYRAILPKERDCANLIVPICLSSTHVAFSSIRVEPTWIVLGEAAGNAAVLAINNKTSVQKISYEKLAEQLKASGQIIYLPKD